MIPDPQPEDVMNQQFDAAQRSRKAIRTVWTFGTVSVLSLCGCQTTQEPSQAFQPTVSVHPRVVSQSLNRQTSSSIRQVADVQPDRGSAKDRPANESLIDLGIALRLAGVENPTINLAREMIREAQAEQTAARALLLPTLSIGGNFNLHRGNLQQASGTILDVNRQSLYLGAAGSGTVAIPGVRLFAHLGDAAYEPLAAQQRLVARQADAHAVENDILLRVATAYLEMIGAEERVRLLKQGEADLGEVVRLTAVYAKAGQGRTADANRTATNFQLLAKETQVAEEERAVAQARLARLINLDTAVQLRTPEGAVPMIRLVPADQSVESLVAIALSNRPELFARSADIGQAQVRRRQEAIRPYLPILSVGFSAGAFGGGSNRASTTFGPLEGRTDFDVAAVWNIDGFGFGNRARVRRTEAGIGQRVAALERTKTEIGREVAEAHALVQAAGQQFETAQAALSIAVEGLRLETERIKQAQGRPIEVLDSFRQLLDARLEVLRAIVAFDIAQFRLFTAVGNTPDVPAEPSAKP
jgi:outer membrane protein TolC